MAKLTRRGLIRQVSIGAGAAGVLVFAGTHLPFAPTPSAHTATHSPSAPAEPMVVCITDHTAGQLIVMRGEREITITNPGLVQSLLSL